MNRTSWLTFVVFSLLCLAGAQRARGADALQVARARGFLEKADRTKKILNSMHFGTTPIKGAFNQLFTKVTVNGTEKPGFFAIEMRYNWKGGLTGNGETDVQFFFNDKGNLFDVKAVRCNARLFGPFDGGNLVLGLVKGVIKEMAKNDPKEKEINRFVDACKDIRQLMILQLQLEQLLGK
jgi:hypothetical protein